MAGKHPKYIQELLGHANIAIALDTYSHVIEGMDGGHRRRAANAILGCYCCYGGLRLALTGEYPA
jgi:integrase